MDASDLRVFEAVARHGSMSRAANALNTVQSNVTARVRALEEELGTPLFRRHSRGAVLTDAGRRLMPFAARARLLFDDARRAVADQGTPAGRLDIGSLETTAAMRLSPVLAGFAAAYPAVDLTLTTGTTAELIEAALERRVDAALVCGPVQHPDLVCESVFEEELAVAAAPSVTTLDALRLQHEVRIVVLRAGCSYRQRLEEILTRRGVVGLRRLELGTIDAILGCVAAGLGVTLLPRALLEPARRAGRVSAHALPPAEATVETLFVRRRDGFVSSALTAFSRHIRPASQAADAEKASAIA